MIHISPEQRRALRDLLITFLADLRNIQSRSAFPTIAKEPACRVSVKLSPPCR